MAHLSFEYSKDLSNHTDLKLFCDVMRASMIKTTYFPIGGIRVRGFAADVISIADGRPNYNFIDIILRMGEGRSTDEKKIIRLKDFNQNLFKLSYGKKKHFLVKII